MKKLPLALAVAALGLSANVLAADWFVGATVGTGFNDVSVKNGGDIRKPDEPMLYGVRVGTYLNDSMRIYGSYITGDDDAKRSGTKTEVSQDQFLLSADYLFSDGNLRPFVGLTIGMNETEFKVRGGQNIKKDNNKFAYGAQLGLLYSLNSVEFEGGYRHLWHDNTMKHGDVKLENKETGNLYLGIAYRF